MVEKNFCVCCCINLKNDRIMNAKIPIVPCASVIFNANSPGRYSSTFTSISVDFTQDCSGLVLILQDKTFYFEMKWILTILMQNQFKFKFKFNQLRLQQIDFFCSINQFKPIFVVRIFIFFCFFNFHILIFFHFFILS